MVRAANFGHCLSHLLSLLLKASEECLMINEEMLISPGLFSSYSRIGRRRTCLMFLGIAVTAAFVCVGLHLRGKEHPH